jgi:hypothetical protein
MLPEAADRVRFKTLLLMDFSAPFSPEVGASGFC